MLHALLHGKLDRNLPEPYRWEDALTSTVFGTLVLVEAWDLLAQWLQVVPQPKAPSRRDCDCWFWPRLAGGVEPDVVLRLDDVLVVVEAKYGSGRSDLPGDGDEAEKPVDQLRRQHDAIALPPEARPRYSASLENALRECRPVQAFVVDGRVSKARQQHAESVRQLPDHSPLHFITWQELYKILLMHQTSDVRWVQDLRTYLEFSGLASFQGIPRQVAPAEQLRAIGRWGSVQRRASAPRWRAIATLLAPAPSLGALLTWKAARNE